MLMTSRPPSSDEDLFVRSFLDDLCQVGGDHVAAYRALRSALGGETEAWAELYAIVAAAAPDGLGGAAARLHGFLIENSDLERRLVSNGR